MNECARGCVGCARARVCWVRAREWVLGARARVGVGCARASGCWVRARESVLGACARVGVGCARASGCWVRAREGVLGARARVGERMSVRAAHVLRGSQINYTSTSATQEETYKPMTLVKAGNRPAWERARGVASLQVGEASAEDPDSADRGGE